MHRQRKTLSLEQEQCGPRAQDRLQVRRSQLGAQVPGHVPAPSREGLGAHTLGRPSLEPPLRLGTLNETLGELRGDGGQGEHHSLGSS